MPMHAGGNTSSAREEMNPIRRICGIRGLFVAVSSELIWTSCCKVVTAGRQEDCMMQHMTPEERFTKIENLLATVAQCQAMQVENQARRDAEIDKHNAVIEKHN